MILAVYFSVKKIFEPGYEPGDSPLVRGQSPLGLDYIV